MGETKAPSAKEAPFWEVLRLDELDSAQWEALCDGCGKCCLHKLEDEITGQIFPTNVACRLLDRRTGRCSDYARRRSHVPDCVHLTPSKAVAIDWLPSSCAYRLRAEGLPLPAWHPLVTGDPDSTRAAGHSVSGWTVSEVDAGPLEHHILADEDEPFAPPLPEGGVDGGGPLQPPEIAPSVDGSGREWTPPAGPEFNR